VNRYLLIIFSVWLFNGCGMTSIRYLGSGSEMSARHSLLDELNAWNIKGRISVISTEDSWNGTLNWSQDSDNYEIRIIGPLGQGSLHIKGDKNTVTLQTSDKKKPVTAPSAEALLEKQMGWQMPVSELKYWVKAIPNPHGNFKDAKFDKLGRPVSFTQSGWFVQFFKYQKFKGFDMPRKVYLENDRFKIKMIIKRWELEV